MTKAQLKAIQELRHEGCAVCVFTPKELEGANPHFVENQMAEAGYEAICNLKD